MWYSASLYFEATHSPADSKESIWEHRVVLIDATDEIEAAKLASEYGKRAEHSYTNMLAADVTWRFDSLEKVQLLEVDQLKSELELYSRFLRSSEVESLKQPFDN